MSSKFKLLSSAKLLKLQRFNENLLQQTVKIPIRIAVAEPAFFITPYLTFVQPWINMSYLGTNPELPSASDYENIELDYFASLTARKRQKALISQEMFDNIWDVLHDPHGSSLMTSQFRYWVRKMFTLATLDNGNGNGNEDPDGELKSVVLHENRPVAVKTQIYDILCYCHRLCDHGGRDRTTAAVRAHFSWIPKELVARFVKVCPKCLNKKAGYWGIVPKGSKEKRDRVGIVDFEDSNMLRMNPGEDEDDVHNSSKKREAWNKQPAINTEIPLDFILARFPQPSPCTPNLTSPDMNQGTISNSSAYTHKKDQREKDQNCVPWLADLVGLPRDTTSLPRSQSTTDATFPRPSTSNLPPLVPLVTSVSDGPPPDHRNYFLVRPVRRRYNGHDLRSPSPVFSDDEEDRFGTKEVVARSTKENKENRWPAIDPTLLDNPADPSL